MSVTREKPPYDLFEQTFEQDSQTTTLFVVIGKTALQENIAARETEEDSLAPHIDSSGTRSSFEILGCTLLSERRAEQNQMSGSRLIRPSSIVTPEMACVLRLVMLHDRLSNDKLRSRQNRLRASSFMTASQLLIVLYLLLFQGYITAVYDFIVQFDYFSSKSSYNGRDGTAYFFRCRARMYGSS
ncbi:hypothetical protein J7T55_014017 [Diaporthe amygdali]|uniref:uncharacterized protein n=1 Tax=Phomopsis amygdali TaxID=1214568 RepID=UPI0022FE5262|nr:uncharacterized protein J7T55_014017 [Diaporthe amygdali]KAJ0119812.1 hypothetical protein J7T55_014017 [Diaporthe amygdali]